MENFISHYMIILMNNNTLNTFILELRQISRKTSGHGDINCLSKYLNFEEYTTALDPLNNNYFSVIHINIRSLQKN